MGNHCLQIGAFSRYFVSQPQPGEASLQCLSRLGRMKALTQPFLHLAKLRRLDKPSLCWRDVVDAAPLPRTAKTLLFSKCLSGVYIKPAESARKVSISTLAMAKYHTPLYLLSMEACYQIHCYIQTIFCQQLQFNRPTRSPFEPWSLLLVE